MIASDVPRPVPLRRRPALRRGVHWLSLSLLVIGVQAACRTEDTNGPSLNRPVIALTNAAGLADMLADEQARVVPALPASARRADMVTALDALVASVRSANASRAQESVGTARTALGAYASTVGGDAGAEADLEALRFAVDAIEAQVTVDLLTGI